MTSPLVIVGVGGSGTGVFSRLAEVAGRHMGIFQNETNDAFVLHQFANRWCERVHRRWQAGETLSHQAEFEADLRDMLIWHRYLAPSQAPWGWKQPRSIHLLPALEAMYRGDLLVLHAIRDGRDVAFGKDIHLTLTERYTVPSELGDAPKPVKLAHLWDTVNRLAADFGESVLGERYLRVSLEALCDDPQSSAEEIASFVGGELADGAPGALVKRPSTIGRWRDADQALVEKVLMTSRQGLERFGYS